MPMKKGSAVIAVSRHIRGSIEDISKIKRFTISSAKIRKKVYKSISQRVYKYFLIKTINSLTYRPIDLLSLKTEDHLRHNLDLAFQAAVDMSELAADS